MSKLYGKMWAEGSISKMSTRQGHREFTSQVLYGSKGDSRIAAEITVRWNEKHGFIMDVYIPALSLTKHAIHLPFED